MRLDKEQYKIIRDLSKKHGLTQEQVIEIIKSPFAFIREKIELIEIDLNWSEEEFKDHTYNFNLPSIGKFHASYKNLTRLKNEEKRRSSKGSGKIQK